MKAVRRMVWLATIGGLLTVCGSGCRLFNKESSGGNEGWPTIRDPLMGRDKIPATNLPTGRDRERTGTKLGDPLLGKVAAGERWSDLPPTERKEPFRLTPETSTANLASGRTEDPLLTIPGTDSADRRPTGNNTGRGAVPLKGSQDDRGYEERITELKRLGVKVSEAVREGTEYVIRGDLETSDGARRRFEGAGSSPTAAAVDLLEQIRSEMR